MLTPFAWGTLTTQAQPCRQLPDVHANRLHRLRQVPHLLAAARWPRPARLSDLRGVLETSDLNGKPYTVQYFERAVFEMHPENQPPNDVLLSQLGTYLGKANYTQASPGAMISDPAAISYKSSIKYQADDIEVFAVGADHAIWDSRFHFGRAGLRSEVLLSATRQLLRMRMGEWRSLCGGRISRSGTTSRRLQEGIGPVGTLSAGTSERILSRFPTKMVGLRSLPRVAIIRFGTSHNRRPATGTWTQWSAFGGGQFIGDPAVVLNGAGQIELFVRCADKSLWHNAQSPTDEPAWTGWTPLGGYLTSDPAAAVNADGRIEVFARGGDHALWRSTQTSPGGPWNTWVSMGGVLSESITAVTTTDGRIEVLARAPDNTVWHIGQVWPGYWH